PPSRPLAGRHDCGPACGRAYRGADVRADARAYTLGPVANDLPVSDAIRIAPARWRCVPTLATDAARATVAQTVFQVDTVTRAARVELRHLDILWVQVSGTCCNIECRPCFNNSGPRATTFGHMTLEAVDRAIEAAAARGVREIYFTGGEPFLNAHLLDMIAGALAVAPTTVLTNGMLISDRVADTLADLAIAARYSLEMRVSLD